MPRQSVVAKFLLSQIIIVLHVTKKRLASDECELFIPFVKEEINKSLRGRNIFIFFI